MPTLLHCLVQDSLDFSFPLSKPSQLLRPGTVTKYRWRLLSSSAHTSGRASWCVPDPAVHRTCWKHQEHKGFKWPISWGSGHSSPCREPSPHHLTGSTHREGWYSCKKKRENLPNVLPSKAVRLSYKKHVLSYLCSSLLQWSLPACLCRTRSLFPAPLKDIMGFTNLLLRTQWALVRETPLLYHRWSDFPAALSLLGSTVYKKWGRSLLPEDSGAVYGHQGAV